MTDATYLLSEKSIHCISVFHKVTYSKKEAFTQRILQDKNGYNGGKYKNALKIRCKEADCIHLSTGMCSAFW